MNHQQKIDEAIRVLAAQRELLGHDVVAVTVAALDDMLADANTDLTAQPTVATVLVVQGNGPEQLSEAEPIDDLSLLLNEYWQRLRGIVKQEGGIVAQTTARQLTAVFGLTSTHRDDPLRAVRAALAIQADARLFFDQEGDLSGLPLASASQPDSLPPLSLSIALHTGSVYGEQRDNGQQTLEGEGVALVQQLLQSVTEAGVYLTQATYALVANRVKVEALTLSEPYTGSAYWLLGLSLRLADQSGWHIPAVETPLYGRDDILARLRQRLEACAVGQGHVVTIIGEPGSGKSRVAYDFGQWVRQHWPDVMLLQAKVDQGTRPFPYALARNLITNILHIQDNEPAVLVLDKLASCLRWVQIDESDSLHQQAHLLGQLLGLAVVDELPQVAQLDLPADDQQARYRREKALTIWDALVEKTLLLRPATLILLEDVHLADEESIHLMAYVASQLVNAPVLVICLAQPILYERWSHWPHLNAIHDLGLPHTRLDLPPLADEASRQVARHHLDQLALPSEPLVDWLVDRAHGNPLFIEQLVKLLLDKGLITETAVGGQLSEQAFADWDVPATLADLLPARFEQLSSREQTMLQRASVMGRTFWETAVLAMSETPLTKPSAAVETNDVWQTLVERGFIFKQAVSNFAGATAYLFKHNLLRQIVYESISPRHRPLYHKQVADWLSEQTGERVAEFASQIAFHYELAGKETRAAGLYELAGRRAQEMSNFDAAVDNYRKTLSLLTDKPRHTTWLLRLQEHMGPLLVRRLRLVEAAQLYLTLQYTAALDGELSLQAQAWLGLATVQQEQARYNEMLDSAKQGRQAARLITNYVQEVQASLLQSQTHIYRGELPLAQALAENALAVSQKTDLPRVQVLSLGLLCQIYHAQFKTEDALALREQLEQQCVTATESGQQVSALCYLVLADMYRATESFSLAHDALNKALALYRQEDNLLGLAQTEAALGRLALRRGQVDDAVAYLRSAVTMAQSAGDEYGRVRYQLYLSRLLLHTQQFDEAQRGLDWLLNRTTNAHRMEDWWGQLRAYDLLVQIYVAQQRPELALATARQAYALAQKRDSQQTIATAWRLLALALRGLQLAQADKATVKVDEQSYSVDDCFRQSWHAIKMANPQIPCYRQQAERTLRAWREYTLAHDTADTASAEAAFARRLASLETAPGWHDLHMSLFDSR